jgi:hypothetical protein
MVRFGREVQAFFARRDRWRRIQGSVNSLFQSSAIVGLEVSGKSEKLEILLNSVNRDVFFEVSDFRCEHGNLLAEGRP